MATMMAITSSINPWPQDEDQEQEVERPFDEEDRMASAVTEKLDNTKSRIKHVWSEDIERQPTSASARMHQIVEEEEEVDAGEEISISQIELPDMNKAKRKTSKKKKKKKKGRRKARRGGENRGESP